MTLKIRRKSSFVESEGWARIIGVEKNLKAMCYHSHLDGHALSLRRLGLCTHLPVYREGGPSARIAGLCWLWFWVFQLLPGSAWADGKRADLAEELGETVEHHRQKSNQPNYPIRWVALYCILRFCSGIPTREPQYHIIPLWAKTVRQRLRDSRICSCSEELILRHGNLDTHCTDVRQTQHFSRQE